MTDGLGTLCIQRMIDKMFIEIDDTVSFIVHINAHRTGNSFYHIGPWKSVSYGLDLTLVSQVVLLRGVVRHRPRWRTTKSMNKYERHAFRTKDLNCPPVLLFSHFLLVSTLNRYSENPSQARDIA
jgi:hypothetical protein